MTQAGDITRLVSKEPEPEEVSYLREVITSQASVVGLSSAVVLGAVLSIPLGVGLAAVPVIAAVTAQSLAALFLPSSPVFRAMIDRRRRRERRKQRQESLLAELSNRADPNDPNWDRYHRMVDRGRSLWTLAERSDGAATYDAQLEALADVTVDFLGLWLAVLAMQEHHELTDAKALEKRLRTVEKQLEEVSSAVDRKHLEKAKADLEGMLKRWESLGTRAMAMDTAMLAMADAFEEVYHRIVASSGSSGELAEELNRAVEQLRVQEELDMAVDDEMERLLASRRSAAAQGSKR